MKVSNPVVINALLAKNAEVEGAVAENAEYGREFYAIFRRNGGANESHDGPFKTIEEARKFGIQQQGARSGVSFVGVGDEDLNYVWHNARANNAIRPGHPDDEILAAQKKACLPYAKAAAEAIKQLKIIDGQAAGVLSSDKEFYSNFKSLTDEFHSATVLEAMCRNP